MRLIHRPIEAWPGKMTRDAERQFSPFRRSSMSNGYRRDEVPLGDTLQLLERELKALGCRDEAVLQVAVRERDIRLDGGIRDDAKPDHPGVILNFKSRHGELSYACDTFRTWTANLRAIAKGLEALRLVDRYGVGNGAQYTGYRALGAGTPMPAAQVSVADAAQLIASTAWPESEIDPQEVIDNLDLAYKEAAKRLHPDAGGTDAEFQRLQEAKRVIEAFA
jgi:hypothetical protein